MCHRCAEVVVTTTDVGVVACWDKYIDELFLIAMMMPCHYDTIAFLFLFSSFFPPFDFLSPTGEGGMLNLIHPVFMFGLFFF